MLCLSTSFVLLPCSYGFSLTRSALFYLLLIHSVYFIFQTTHRILPFALANATRFGSSHPALAGWRTLHLEWMLAECSPRLARLPIRALPFSFWLIRWHSSWLRPFSKPLSCRIIHGRFPSSVSVLNELEKSHSLCGKTNQIFRFTMSTRLLGQLSCSQQISSKVVSLGCRTAWVIVRDGVFSNQENSSSVWLIC